MRRAPVWSLLPGSGQSSMLVGIWFVLDLGGGIPGVRMLSRRLAVVRATPMCVLSALGWLVLPLASKHLLLVPSTRLSGRSHLVVGEETCVRGQKVCLVLQFPFVVNFQYSN